MTSKPATLAMPLVAGRKPVRMRIVVVLPAPLGPRKPTISPRSTRNEASSTARVRAKSFVRCSTSIMAVSAGSRPHDTEKHPPMWAGKGPRAGPGSSLSSCRAAAALLLHFEVGVDDPLVPGTGAPLPLARPPAGRGGLAAGSRTPPSRPGARLGVEDLPDLLGGALQGLDRAADRRRVLPLHGLLDRLPRRLDPLAVGGGDLGPVLPERLLRAVHELVGLVAQVDDLAALLVLLAVPLGLPRHPLHLLLGEPRGGLDEDLLLLLRAEVLRGDLEDPVRVDVERDLDLGEAARGGGDAVEVEAGERAVVLRELPLPLEDVDLDGGLAVGGGREDLLLALRDRRVALDDARHHPPERLDPEGERGDVEEDDVLHLPHQDARLDRRPEGDRLVGVDALVRLLPEDLLHHRLDGGGARRPADEDDLVDLRRLQLRVGERPLAGDARAIDQVLDERLELRARQVDRQVLRARGVGRDEGEVDRRLDRARELALRLLARLLQALERHPVAAEVDPVRLAELLGDEVDQLLVEVVPAEVGVAVRREDLEDPVPDLEDGDVEGPPAEVVDRDLLVLLLLVEAVGNRR